MKHPAGDYLILDEATGVWKEDPEQAVRDDVEKHYWKHVGLTILKDWRLYLMLVPMILIFALFYFMMIRPQQRKEKERRKMISEIRAGARILMTNGFVGTVKEARDNSFLVEIAPGVTAEVVKSAVQQVVSTETESSAK